MYTRTKTYAKDNNVEITRFVETLDGVPDIGNSTLLYRLDRASTKNTYTITKYEGRIDLIAREIYGNEKFSWILLYTNRIGVNDLKRGLVLEYIPFQELQSILNEI